LTRSPPAQLEHLLRPLVPEVLGSLVRRYGRFDACEDAVQEAMLAAALQWPAQGVPENPRAWLATVASRRLIDELRGDRARRHREEVVAEPEARRAAGDPGQAPLAHDDTLALLFLCCHESLSASSQIALTLRAVGGLSTAEIASAFLVPEATMAQRISRSKARIRTATLQLPRDGARNARLGSVLHVLYLIFNEGYSASSGGMGGSQVHRLALAEEAIRLTRMLRRLLPDEDEARGLLALMLLTHARHGARTDAAGALIPLADQDRGRWDRSAIDEGIGLVTGALASGPVGAYQLQAAIAAVHAEAPSTAETDWRQIIALYELLERVAPSPVFALNRTVAVGMLHGPADGLELLAQLERDERLSAGHRLPAVRGHLLEMAGDAAGAAAAYEAASHLTRSLPERDYLQGRAAAARAADVRRTGPPA
jgi:RNA polymerase sigma factor (sigma-70 family)